MARTPKRLRRWRKALYLQALKDLRAGATTVQLGVIVRTPRGWALPLTIVIHDGALRFIPHRLPPRRTEPCLPPTLD